MQTIIFDDIMRPNFYPLCLNRSVGDLRCGILKLRQRLEACFPSEGDTNLVIDPQLVPLYQERHPDWQINLVPTGMKLYVSSRLKITDESIAKVHSLEEESMLMDGTILVAAKTTTDIDPANPIMASSQPCNLPLYNNISDIIHDNSRMLAWDFEHYFYDKDNYFETEPGVMVLNPYNVWIAEDVKLSPGVVLDAAEGPIVLDAGVSIMPNAVITGPAYIGKKTLIKIGAKIYGGTSIGPVCKVGGEVEGTIIQAYTNKQHDGFLGHAYIGEWVNLGADTNNSDLKNTYKNVFYYSYPHARKVDSGTQFLGCVIGDHSKTGINCSINTGTVIGIGCNLWGSNLISDFIPDFSWGQANQLTPYRYEAFCETATLVKQRRKLHLSHIEIDLYQQIINKEYQCKIT